MADYKPHFIFAGQAESNTFVSPPRIIETVPGESPDRASHGSFLLQRIEGLKAEYAAIKPAQTPPEFEELVGILIEFASFLASSLHLRVWIVSVHALSS